MKPMTLCITFDDGLLAHAKVAAPMLVEFGWRGAFTVPTEILTKRTLTPDQVKDLCLEGNEDKLMTWDDVRAMIAAGHEVYPHTCSHADLPTLYREGRMDELEREIAEAKSQLSAMTGIEPKFFCLPHSQHNPDIDALVRKHGMEPMNGGGMWRPNFGEDAPEGESFSHIDRFLRKFYYLGIPHVDIVIHGVVRAEGGWRPFEDVADFRRFLGEIKGEVEAGRVRVVGYAQAHVRKSSYFSRRCRQLAFKVYRKLKGAAWEKSIIEL